MLDLIISETSILIFENEMLPYYKIVELIREFLNINYQEKLLPCHYDYIIDEAFKLYEKI